jgi:hypothetical protein
MGQFHNYHIQDITFRQNTRNTNRQKMQLYTYKPTKHIITSIQDQTSVEEAYLHTTTMSRQKHKKTFYIHLILIF